MNDNVFELAKTVDIKSYLENNYGFRFKNNKILCPFHNEKNPSFAVYPSQQTVTCFGGCAWNDGKNTGDIISFVSKYQGIEILEAARQICDDNGILYRRYEKQDKNNNMKASSQMTETDQGQKIHQQMKEKSRILVDKASLHKEDFEKALSDVIVFKLPDDWKSCYLGWDDEEQSIVIVNQSKVTGQVWNIKHKKKRGFDGKWISYPRSQTFPFPFDYFRQHKENRVILCEGEKDALNLLTIGVNCLTLGGAATSWYKHKHLLEGKEVYICFDNDQTGYDNAIRRCDELKETVKKINLVLFCGMEGKLPEHYDISDFIKEHSISNTHDFFGAVSKCSFSDREDAIRVIDRKYKYRNIIEADVSQDNEKSETVTIPEVQDQNNFWKQSSALLMLTTVLLVIALSVHEQLQYEFYTLSRVVNFSVFALVALFSYRQKDIGFTIIFGIMAFLFNPLHPFFLTREIWVVVDVIVLLIIWYYLIIRIKAFTKIFAQSTD